MDKKAHINSIIILAITVAVFLVIFVLTSLTPFIADDYSYSFSYYDHTRISSVSDVIKSAIAHRSEVNGRIFSHALVQLVLLLPKTFFNFINGIAAALLVYSSLRFFRKNNDISDVIILTCGIFAVWCFTPVFGQVFLWLDGSFNYSWAMLVSFLYVLPFFNVYMDKQELKPWMKLIFIVFSFIAGAYSESISIAAIFAAFCFLLLTFLRGKSVSRFLVLSLLFAVVGFVFMMTAPTEMSGRAGEFSLSTIVRNAKLIIQSTQDSLSPLYCAFFVLLFVDLSIPKESNSVCRDYRMVIAASIMFVAGLGSIAAFAFAWYFPFRAMCASCCWTVLACQLLLADLWQHKNRIASAVLGIVFVMFIFSFALGVIDIAVVYKASLVRNAQISTAIANGDTKIAIAPFRPETKYSAAYGLTDIGNGENIWPNETLARYFGFDSVTNAP